MRVLDDRVHELSDTVGTGDIILAGKLVGKSAFSEALDVNTGRRMTDGDTCYYTIQPRVGVDFESGIGTWRTGNRIERTTVLRSSNGNTKVPFAAGSKHIFISNLVSRTAHKAGAFTTGRIPYADANSELTDDADLVFVGDNLGVGVAAPTARIHSAGSTTGAASARIASGTAPTSPNDGDYWNDSTQKAMIAFLAGIKQARAGVIFTGTADGTTVTNTTTETNITPAGVGTLTLPVNFFVVGKTVRLKARGHFTTAAVPGVLLMRTKFGTTPSCSTGNVTPTALLAAAYWEWECDLTCRTTGGSGTIMGQGRMAHDDAKTCRMWGGGAGTLATIDTTASQAIALFAKWGTADAGNTLTCTHLTAEVLN